MEPHDADWDPFEDPVSEPDPEPLEIQVALPTSPDIGSIKSVVLKDIALAQQPRVRREAAYLAIVSRKTGELHHYALTIKSERGLKGRWIEDPQSTVTITTEGVDEIQRLIDFLATVRGTTTATTPGRHLVVPLPSDRTVANGIRQVVTTLSAADQASALLDVLEYAVNNTTLFEALVNRAARDPQLFAEAAAALNLATYRRAVEQLEKLIATPNVREQAFQDLLTKHPWMFGSEYSELLKKRELTVGKQQDFILRRATDDYIELIEIKTPLSGSKLFNYDSSHESYYASADLSKVVAQVEGYIEDLEAGRYEILARDRVDTRKIKAKIVIGCDFDDDQRAALRRFNGHMHRIEVLTFDQLCRIAKRVLRYLQDVLEPPA